ncbi:MAG TPA: hypothetical protein VLF39_04255 [Candidatus Saccharimonadales bacterium]|nr:hypothetical protein [Candidatus Saccharimonadales bacterium]
MYAFLTYTLTQLRFFGAPAVTCSKASNFFALPRWYKYLSYSKSALTGKCEVTIHSWGQYWLIGLAALDIVMRIAGLVAVAFVIWGGFTYLISQGEPDKTAEARRTIVNALIGAVIAVIAASAVGFIGNRLGGT